MSVRDRWGDLPAVDYVEQRIRARQKTWRFDCYNAAEKIVSICYVRDVADRDQLERSLRSQFARVELQEVMAAPNKFYRLAR